MREIKKLFVRRIRGTWTNVRERMSKQDGRNRGPHTHAQGPLREPRGSKYTYEKRNESKIVKRRILYRNVRERDAINVYAVCFYKILVKLFSKPYVNVCLEKRSRVVMQFLIVPILIFDFYYLLGKTSFYLALPLRVRIVDS